MKKMSRIVWEPSYSVHVEAIDAQHRELFGIANRLMDLHESGTEDLLPVITDLVQYLSRHFHAEKMVMMNAMYPDFKQHNADHDLFIERIQDFIKRYKDNERDLESEMILFLTHWIYTHTLNMDRKYGEYILKAGFASSSSYAGRKT